MRFLEEGIFPLLDEKAWLSILSMRFDCGTWFSPDIFQPSQILSILSMRFCAKRYFTFCYLGTLLSILSMRFVICTRKRVSRCSRKLSILSMRFWKLVKWESRWLLPISFQFSLWDSTRCIVVNMKRGTNKAFNSLYEIPILERVEAKIVRVEELSILSMRFRVDSLV